MKILIACEESQAVCKQFRLMGHTAFSADILDCSGGNPEWHIKGDVLKVLNNRWDMVIAFPPCTHLAVSGAHRFKEKRENGKQKEAIEFFLKFVNCAPRWAIENPVGIMGGNYLNEHFLNIIPEITDKFFPRKPDQIIQPYEYGHPESKKTCLWLGNLPKLQPTSFAEFKKYRCKCGNTFDAELGKYGCCDGPAKPLWDNMTPSGQNKLGPSAERAKLRSKTYLGIAEAMARQWGNLY